MGGQFSEPDEDSWDSLKHIFFMTSPIFAPKMNGLKKVSTTFSFWLQWSVLKKRTWRGNFPCQCFPCLHNGKLLNSSSPWCSRFWMESLSTKSTKPSKSGRKNHRGYIFSVKKNTRSLTACSSKGTSY